MTMSRPATAASKTKADIVATSDSTNFKVFVRVRPLTAAEAVHGSQSSTISVLDERVVIFDPSHARKSRTRKNGVGGMVGIGVKEHNKRNQEVRYAFDRVFGENSAQREVFERTTQPLMDGVLEGYNATVFAYGSTGAGKTYTMSGTPSDPGCMVLVMCELFDRIQQLRATKIIDLKMTYLEIYNETIRDLLVDPPSPTLDMREEGNKGVVIAGLSEHEPSSVQQVMTLLKRGNANRMMSPTLANATSSRSHAVLQIHIQQRDRTGDVATNVKVATLSLIDLAGSERASVADHRGERKREGGNINRSLLALGNCINLLCSSKKNQHIPYRDSKLTRLLKYSLGGNCRTVMIANVSPSIHQFEDSYNTLVYANRAKNIKTSITRNTVQVNYHIREYVQIIANLRQEIAELKENSASTEQLPVKEPPPPALDELKSQIDHLGKELELFESHHALLSGEIMMHEMILECVRLLAKMGEKYQQNETIYMAQLDSSVNILLENLDSLQMDLVLIYDNIDGHKSKLLEFRHKELGEFQSILDDYNKMVTLKVSQMQHEAYSQVVQKVFEAQRQWTNQLAHILLESESLPAWKKLVSSFLDSPHMKMALEHSKQRPISSASRVEEAGSLTLVNAASQWNFSLEKNNAAATPIRTSVSASRGSPIVTNKSTPIRPKSAFGSTSNTPKSTTTPIRSVQLTSPHTAVKVESSDALSSWKYADSDQLFRMVSPFLERKKGSTPSSTSKRSLDKVSISKDSTPKDESKGSTESNSNDSTPKESSAYRGSLFSAPLADIPEDTEKSFINKSWKKLQSLVNPDIEMNPITVQEKPQKQQPPSTLAKRLPKSFLGGQSKRRFSMVSLRNPEEENKRLVPKQEPEKRWPKQGLKGRDKNINDKNADTKNEKKSSPKSNNDKMKNDKKTMPNSDKNENASENRNPHDNRRSPPPRTNRSISVSVTTPQKPSWQKILKPFISPFRSPPSNDFEDKGLKFLIDDVQ